MASGTEPWVILNALLGAFGQIAGFFSLYYAARRYPAVCLAALALLSPVAGGVVWQLLNKVNGWPFYLGGPQNEPYGWYAAVWGATTILPVAFAVTLVSTKARLGSLKEVARWLVSREFALVLTFTALASIFAVAFYGPSKGVGVRVFIGCLGLGFEHCEQAMIVLWALVLACAPALAILFLGRPSAAPRTLRCLYLYAAPAAITASLCLLVLAAYFGLYDYLNLDQKAQIRGLVAGYVVRFGLFWGTWLIIDIRHFRRVATILKVTCWRYVHKPFPR